MGYLTTHVHGCQCDRADRKYETLCEMVKAMKAARELHEADMRRLRDRLQRLIDQSHEEPRDAA